ncbi:MAG: transglutaminase family protein [Candidatus Thermoplasmatota archaeon]|nr:transglutaminase family protein [Candidatus Thermoplasmatota archaeon]
MAGAWRRIREKGYIMPWKMLVIVLRTVPALAKALVKHPVVLMKANRAARKYLSQVERPPVSYTLPPPRDGLSHGLADRRYLRPTHFCEADAPEIVALAHELGAFRFPDREYAEAVFSFVKNNIKLEFVGLDGAVATLRRGSGTCLHQLSLFAALCRAAGLPARYRLYSLALVESMYDSMVGVSSVLKDWYDAFGAFMLHGTAEVCIDGQWVVADPTFTPEYEAAMGVPLAKLGDDPTGMWNYPVEGTMMLLEGLPYGAGFFWNLLVNRIARGEVMKINMSLEMGRQAGRKKLADMDTADYDAAIRSSYRAQMPTVTLERSPQLVFEA